VCVEGRVMNNIANNDNDETAKRGAALLVARGRRGWRVYDWADRARWLLQNFVRTPGEAALMMGSAAVVSGVGGFTVYDGVQAKRLAREVATVEQVRSTETSTVFTIEGLDKAGRRGLFDVVVAKKEFLWVKGSADDLEKDGQTIKNPDIANAVFDGEVSAALAGAREIVAVGTASQEGAAGNEKERAGRRADATAKLSQSAVGPDTPVWALNLGQYREPCAACETSGTSWQRPFIVVAVKSLEVGANLGEALADAMTGKTTLPSPKSYSAFEISKVR
jgi:hypothetical protein